jgi:tRNA nucleotidyltransferase (CCA-adding enzyme)
VLNYGSFDAVIESAAVWKPPHIINTERHLGIPLHQFKDKPLVIIDPVDPGRNVSAVVSGDNFVKFVAASKQYKQTPSVNFFFLQPPKPLTFQQTAALQKRETKFIALVMKRPDVIDDVLYPQLRRAMNRIAHLLEHHEFHVLRAFEFVDKYPVIVFELETWSLPAVKRMVGPPIFAEKHTNEFLSKYSRNSVYVHENRMVAEIPRKHKTAISLLNDFLRDAPPALAEKGMPKYIAAQVSKKKVLEHHEFWKLVKKDKALSDYLRKKYFANIIKN